MKPVGTCDSVEVLSKPDREIETYCSQVKADVDVSGSRSRSARDRHGVERVKVGLDQR